MSVIAAKKKENKIIYGADSIIVSGYTQQKDKKAKIQEVNDIVICSTGRMKDHSLLCLFCETHKPESMTEMGLVRFFNEYIEWVKKKDSNYEHKTYHIIGDDKYVFYVEDFWVKPIEDYYARGAGEDFALAALYLGQSVHDSIKAACELSVYCEEPINIIEK